MICKGSAYGTCHVWLPAHVAAMQGFLEFASAGVVQVLIVEVEVPHENQVPWNTYVLGQQLTKLVDEDIPVLSDGSLEKGEAHKVPPDVQHLSGMNIWFQGPHRTVVSLQGVAYQLLSSVTCRAAHTTTFLVTMLVTMQCTRLALTRLPMRVVPITGGCTAVGTGPHWQVHFSAHVTS